jgi:hypothetical protein
MRPRVEKKINHHFLPQLYLKGFVESQGSPFVWVYSKGAGYNPGERRDKNNPCRTSIRIAGARKGFYALRDEKGMMDFNTYEDLLEKLEKPANPVFAKIRAQKMIDESDRQILASYIVTLMKRVPRGQEKLTSLWFKAHRMLNEAVDIDRIVSRIEAQVSEDTEKLARLEEARREYASVMKKFGAEMPRDSLLNQTVADARIAPVLCQMTWYFLIAPKGQRYLTGDNPVFYFENIGIANLGSQWLCCINRNGSGLPQH